MEKRPFDTVLTERLIDMLPAMVGYWHSDLICAYANERYRTWYLKSPGEIKGMHMRDFLGADLFTKDEPFIRQVLRGEPVEFERTLIRVSGEVAYAWVNYIPEVVQGKIRGFISFISDITELKTAQIESLRLNMELEARTRQAEEANEAKKIFLANVSHELRTPMVGIISLAELLEKDSASTEEKNSLGLIRRSGEKMLHLLKDILDTSMIEAGKFRLESRPFRLPPMLRDITLLASKTASQKSLDISAELSPDLPETVNGDADRLSQILTNLLNNAVKFTAAGSVKLKVSVIQRNDDSVLIRFAVTDTGIGIEEEKQAEIFLPFVQADGSATRKYGGAGLGLAISKQIAESMGGQIGVSSEHGRGAEFWLTLQFGLPRADPQGFSVPNNATDSDPVSDRPLRILVAEDDEVTRTVVQLSLRKLGHLADFAGNGFEAVEKLCKREYDVVLMDYMMPGMDGIHATRVIRRSEAPVLNSQVPIVAFSANALPEMEQKCIAAGMNALLKKPASLDELNDAVKRWSRRPPNGGN